MPTPPLGPGQRLFYRGEPVPHQPEQQPADLGHAQRDQPRAPFFAGRAARDRITATTARANRLSVTCRCHPDQLRTSYSSSPQSPFASSNRSSTAHRAPATRTSSSGVVPGGPPQAKYATSSGSDVLRRISTHRAYTSASAVTHLAGTPDAAARSTIRRASRILVANSTSSGTPASSRRSASVAHSFGRYNARSSRARPLSVAYPRNTPTWQFSTRPAVPLYWRATPQDLVPFLRNPVSSTTSTLSG